MRKLFSKTSILDLTVEDLRFLIKDTIVEYFEEKEEEEFQEWRRRSGIKIQEQKGERIE